MHVYERRENGKRGKYIGFAGTREVRNYWTGEKIGEGYPPHWGFWKRMLNKR